MSRLLEGLVEDFETVDSILTSKKLKARGGGLSGDVYKRFPKNFDEASPAAKFLKHKQLFLIQDLTRKKICDKNFSIK